MPTQKYVYIDVMRGVAILLVLGLHTGETITKDAPLSGQLVRFGQFGVQLFFVASALTLALSMRATGVSVNSTLRFYLRRFFRIAPLYYVGIAFYYAIWIAHTTTGAVPYTGPYTLPDLVANATFTHGVYFYAMNRIVPGGWSIGTEMLFYAVFPILFLGVTSRRRAVLFIVGSLLLNLAFQALVSLRLGRPIQVANGAYFYFLLPNQLPVFACGLWLFQALRDPRPPARPWRDLVVGLLILAAALLVRRAAGGESVMFAVLPTIAGVGFALLGRQLSHIRLDGRVARIIASIGRKSYSMYILHFPIAWDLTPWLSRQLVAAGVDGPVALPLLLLLAAALSYGAALITARAIEEPGIRLGTWLSAVLLPPAPAPSGKTAFGD